MRVQGTAFAAHPLPVRTPANPATIIGKDTHLAYAALLLYVAILFIRPQEWVSAIKGLHILDAVVGLALITWLGHLVHSKWRFRDAPQNWLMLGLFLAALMSHVRHTYLAALIETFQDFGKVVLLYFLIATLADSVRRVRTVIFVMVVGCLFMAIHGILQAHTGVGFGGALPIVRGDVVRVRAFGIFHDPNDLSLMLVTVMPFLLSRIFDRESSLAARFASAGAIMPMLYCVYLTNSRGGWLALAVMAMAYAYLYLPYKKIGLALAPLAFAALIALGPSRMDTISTDEPAAWNRIIAWGYGNRMLKRWPVFGAGKGRFMEFSEAGRVAHNSFVHCWGELGLFGYFFWLGLIVASLKDGRALSKIAAEEADQREMARLGKAGIAALVGFLSAAFFLSRTYIVPLYLLFALVAALRGVYERDVGPLGSGFVLRDSKYVLAAELASIPALYVLIRAINLF